MRRRSPFSSHQTLTPTIARLLGLTRPTSGRLVEANPKASLGQGRHVTGKRERLRAAAAAAGRAERLRCERILHHPASAANLARAAQLAFETDLTATQAIELLKAQRARRTKREAAKIVSAEGERPQRDSGAQRLQREPLAAQIILAGMKRRGEVIEAERPVCDASKMAARIVLAGKKRRGEA